MRCSSLSLIQNLPSASDFCLSSSSYLHFQADGLLCRRCALEGSSAETERESSLGIFHSHSDRRVSVSSSHITLFVERLSLFYHLSLYGQKSTKTGLLHAAIHIGGMWAQFKACPALVCIHWLQISLLYCKNPTFSWKRGIWRWKSYSNKSILQKGKIKKRWERKQEGKKEQRKQRQMNKGDDQVGFYFQIQTADLWKSSCLRF